MKLGLRTIVSLVPEVDEPLQEFASQHGIHLVHIKVFEVCCCAAPHHMRRSMAAAAW